MPRPCAPTLSLRIHAVSTLILSSFELSKNCPNKRSVLAPSFQVPSLP